MNNPAIHASVALERIYDASLERVFAAWADPEQKARWFVGPEDWTLTERAQDFRVGGKERLRGRFDKGPETLYVGRFHQILENQRIVYHYDMFIDQALLSCSLCTVELSVATAGTQLRYTEQVVFLDGKDGRASRERGCAAHLERLAEALRPA